MSFSLRAPLVLVALGMALVASAQVQYVFTGTSTSIASGITQIASFSLVVPTFVTTNTNFAASALQSASFVQSGASYSVTNVQFTFAADTSLLVQIGTSGGNVTQNGWAFGSASTTTYGPHAQILGGTANLNVNAVPEPSALVLAFPALVLLRRRRRA